MVYIYITVPLSNRTIIELKQNLLKAGAMLENAVGIAFKNISSQNQPDSVSVEVMGNTIMYHL